MIINNKGNLPLPRAFPPIMIVESVSSSVAAPQAHLPLIGTNMRKLEHFVLLGARGGKAQHAPVEY